MKASRFLPVTLTFTVAAAWLPACTSQPSAGPSTSSRAAGSQPVRSSEPPPKPTSGPGTANQPVEQDAGRRLVEKAVSAMGGAAVVDGVTSLVLTGTMQQRSPLGEYTASVTTTILYPASVRRDVTLPTSQTISSILTPEGAWITGALGTYEMEKAERERLEASAMRSPLSLLKSRTQASFRVSPGAAPPSGGQGDALVIRFGGVETDVLLDPEGRIIEVSYEGTNPFDPSKKEKIRIAYSDFRIVAGLMIPFASEGWVSQEKVSTIRLDSARVNEVVPEQLFAKPASPTAPSPMPASR